MSVLIKILFCQTCYLWHDNCQTINIASRSSLLHCMPLLQERVQSSLSMLGCGAVAGPLEEGAYVSCLLHFVVHPPSSPVAVLCRRYESLSDIYPASGGLERKQSCDTGIDTCQVSSAGERKSDGNSLHPPGSMYPVLDSNKHCNTRIPIG